MGFSQFNTTLEKKNGKKNGISKKEGMTVNYYYFLTKNVPNSLLQYSVRYIGQLGNVTDLVICFKWCSVTITAAADIIFSHPSRISLSDSTRVGKENVALLLYSGSKCHFLSHSHCHQHTHTLTFYPVWDTWLSEKQMTPVTLMPSSSVLLSVRLH